MSDQMKMEARSEEEVFHIDPSTRVDVVVSAVQDNPSVAPNPRLCGRVVGCLASPTID
jgi:hypothetical protein